MKNSGVKWIGEMPNNWNLIRFRYCFSTGKGLNITKADLIEEGVPVVSYGQVHAKYNSRTHLSDNLLRYIPASLTIGGSRSKLKRNDFVFADTSEDLEGCGNAVFIDSDIAVYAGYHTIIARPIVDGDMRFLAYLFSIQQWRTQIQEKVFGVKVNSITKGLLNDCLLILPPIPEQTAISDFLDAKCTEIDGLLADLEAEIKTLTEYKKSIIDETVLRGLNPKVSLKSSGVDWIGEIPENWDVMPIKFLFSQRKEKNNPIKSKERLSLSIDTGITLYSEKTTNLDRFKEDFTQYQLAHKNDIVLNSMNMIVGAVGRSNYFGCVSPVYYVIYPSNNANPYYYGYLLNSLSIRCVYRCLGNGIVAIDRGNGRINTCRLKVSYYDFSKIEIPVPPLPEQQAIADYLDEKCKVIEQTIENKRQQIEKLKDYKASLIYEYVTGKKQVI